MSTEKRHRWRIYCLTFILGLLLSARIPKAATAVKDDVILGFPGGPDLYFMPSEIYVEPSSTNQTYDIYMATYGFDVTASVIEVSFDPDVLQVTAIDPGEALPVELASGITNSTAQISVGSQPSTPFNGIGKVATLTFNAGLIQSTTYITFTTNTQVAAIGYSGDVLDSTIPGRIVISNTTCNTCFNFDASTGGEITVVDIAYVANRWGAVIGDPIYEHKYDIYCPSGNADEIINILDIQMVANKWGSTSCPLTDGVVSDIAGVNNIQLSMVELPTSTINIHPHTNLIDVGEIITMEVRIENAVTLGGFEFDVLYDPSILNVSSPDSIDVGEFLGSTGRPPSPLEPVIDNVEGKVRIGAFTSGSLDGPNGSGLLMSIVFQAVGAGISDITIEDVILSTTDTDPLSQPNITEGGTIIVSSNPVYLPFLTSGDDSGNP